MDIYIEEEQRVVNECKYIVIALTPTKLTFTKHVTKNK